MTESWATMPVADVRPGDRVRLASGQEMLVSRIEPKFMGMETGSQFSVGERVQSVHDPHPEHYRAAAYRLMRSQAVARGRDLALLEG